MPTSHPARPIGPLALALALLVPAGVALADLPGSAYYPVHPAPDLADGPDDEHADLECLLSEADDCYPAWVARAPGARSYVAAIAPDGARVYAAGDGGDDWVVLAHDAATGAEAWSVRWNGPGNAWDGVFALEASPDGRVVYATGVSGQYPGTVAAAMTFAYDAATGAEVWRAALPAAAGARGQALALSADGARVYVAGQAWRPTTIPPWTNLPDYVVVAYDAQTGDELWRAFHNLGSRNGYDVAYGLAVTPDGARVVVTGISLPSVRLEEADMVTVAYDAATGAVAWLARENGGDWEYGQFVAVSPDGARVVVAGERIGDGGPLRPSFRAYDAATGARVAAGEWRGGEMDVKDWTLSADGARLYATGLTWRDRDASRFYPLVVDFLYFMLLGGNGSFGATTVAFDARTGSVAWSDVYSSRDVSDGAFGVAASADGRRVVVAGVGANVATFDYDAFLVTYDAGTGARAREAIHVSETGDYVDAVVLSPDGSRAFVAGAQDASAVTLAWDVKPP